MLAGGFISQLFKNGVRDKKYISHKQCDLARKLILGKFMLADK